MTHVGRVRGAEDQADGVAGEAKARTVVAADALEDVVGDGEARGEDAAQVGLEEVIEGVGDAAGGRCEDCC